MKRLFSTILVLLVALPPLHASGDSATHCLPSGGHCLITLHGGVGYGLYRDLGTSPLTYRGLLLHPGISVEVRQPQWHYEAMLLTAGGAYGLKLGIPYIQSYGGYPLLGFRVMYNLYSDQRWHLWGGGSVDDLFDIRYNSSLGNASAAFGNFARLNAEGRLECRLHSWLLHARLQLNLLSLCFRPGYAFMDNFDQDIASPTANTFDQYRFYPSVAAGAATDVGATLLLANGNSVGITYQWGYLTSRTTIAAPHLFQTAHHALLFHLGIMIK